MTNPKLSFRNVKRLAKLIRFFRDRDEFTRAEIEAASGLKTTAVGNLIREMWRPGPDRCIRICMWREDRMGRPTVRVYEFGTAPDAPRRPPMTRKEIVIRYQERKERQAQLIAQQAILGMAQPQHTEV